MKILVTGADGFVGQYMCGALLARGHEVVPLVRTARADLPVRHAKNPGVSVDSGTAPIAIDLPNDDDMIRVVDQSCPDAVVHLAALSTIPDSDQLPQIAQNVNVGGTRSVVNALVETQIPARLLFASSCIVYGPTPVEEQPVTESTTPRPNNVYGETKLQAEEQVRAALDGLVAPAIIARPFNHFGPGQEPNFVLSSFARQISRIRAGLDAPVLNVGNLSVRREFLDVRDVIEAYLRLIETPPAGDLYTIATGQPHVLEDLVRSMGEIADVQFEIEPDPARMRPNDLEVLYGDASLIKRDTGWAPEYSIDQSLRDLLSYWHAQVGAEVGPRS